jgi:hypothetical protein
MATPKKKPKGVKVPFDLHAGVTARWQVELGLAGYTLLMDASAESVAWVDAEQRVHLVSLADGVPLPLSGALADAKAERSIRFSPDGRRLAVLNVEQEGREFTGEVAIFELAEGGNSRLVSRAVVPRWSTATHGGTGSAPLMVFQPDGARLFVRSTFMNDEGESIVTIIDVESGAVDVFDFPNCVDTLFDLAVHGDRLYALFGAPGDDAGLRVFALGGSLREVARSKWCSGDALVIGAHGAWGVGGPTWCHRFDESGSAPQPTAALAEAMVRGAKEREARRKELLARAKSAWERQHLESCANDWTSLNVAFAGGVSVAQQPDPEPGLRSYRNPGVSLFALAQPFKEDDVVICDGYQIALWKERDGHLEVTRLVDDVQRAVQHGRLLDVRVVGSRLAVGWRKARSSMATTLTCFDLADL